MSGFGGGIENTGTGTLLVTGSLLRQNQAGVSGGGIDTGDSNVLTVLNSTFFGNSATTAGGGVNNRNQAGISFSTIAGNTANAGANLNTGLIALGQPATSTVKNSILASGNTTNCGGAGTLTDSGGNIATDNTCGTFTQVTVPALNLAALANNGGPTDTMALQTGSVAIDAAPNCTDVDAASVTQDQRGMSRPVDGNGSTTAECDVGAFEVQGARARHRRRPTRRRLRPTLPPTRRRTRPRASQGRRAPQRRRRPARARPRPP